MHDLAFADAFRPKRFKILGLSLLDYAIGHELALQQQRNELVVGGFEKLDWQHKVIALRKAVLVCSRKRPLFFSRWQRSCGKYLLKDEVRKFGEYRDYNSQCLPQKEMTRDPKANHRYFGGPHLARLLNYVTEHHELMIQAHFDGSPLNFPLGLAAMLYQVHTECAGGLWIKNFHDLEFEASAMAHEKSNPESTFAMGEDAVQAAGEKWNREHPDCPVVLPKSSKSKVQSSKSDGRNN